MKASKNTVPLRRACLDEAMKIVEAKGVDQLSMREVSRRLGVSHQAPYKHFASRDHILAEIIGSAFEEFAEFMQSHSRSADNALDEMHAMGLAYIDYGLSNPLKYRLMFSASLPDPEQHPKMLEQADRCFALLRESLSKLDYAQRPCVDEKRLERDAMMIWTVTHGLVTALTSDVMPIMPVTQDTHQNAIAHTLLRIDTMLRGDVPRDEHMTEIQKTIKVRFPNLEMI